MDYLKVGFKGCGKVGLPKNVGVHEACLLPQRSTVANSGPQAGRDIALILKERTLRIMTASFQ